jgi:thiol:disulfide interchange protein
LDEERKSIIQQQKALQILQERIIKQDVILKKQGEVSKADVNKPEAIKAEISKPEASKPDVSKLELDKIEKERQNLIEQRKQQEKEIEQQKKIADEREKAIGEFDKKSQETRSVIVKTFLGGLGIFLTKLLEEGAKKILEFLIKK